MVAADQRPLDALIEAAGASEPDAGLPPGARRGAGLAVIAEIKRRSPSKGDLARRARPRRPRPTYERGGATCLSVLTDTEFFGGSVDDLQQARAATSLPVLRKDFTVAAHDVADARLMGADAVLLIAAALDRRELVELHRSPSSSDSTCWSRCTTKPELDVAVAAGATLVGVNQRDLVTFEVDHERAVRMAAAIPDGVVKVAESGVRGPDDAGRLADAGYDAVLVGETLVTSPDPAAAVAALDSRGD